jgi:nucleoside diphosphate-linked moiety X motif 19, mitochondrial
MPNGICFPGGAIDQTDEFPEWLDFLKKSKVPLEKLQIPSKVQRPFIFHNQKSLLDRKISLRINAIRETFEEMGIMLCKNQDDSYNSPLGSFLDSKSIDIPTFQKQIHNHEKTLLSFCEELKITPDITNIYDWSCWLTPNGFRPKRFETAFFLIGLNSIPKVYPELTEVADYSWNTPDELLQKYSNREIWLPPPQFVEMRRLHTVKSFDKLIEIAKNRSQQNMELLFPLRFKTKEGFLSILPGDDLYHENPNYYELDHDTNQYEQFTFNEMRKNCTKLCRSEQKDLYDVALYSNFEPSDGHISIESDELICPKL